MTRLRRFIHGVVSAYAVLIVNALSSLISVPLALHYLSTSEFGVWVVSMQVAAYLSFLDIGMSMSMARLLIDHKDERANRAYGSMILTGLLVSVAQGILVLVVGLGLSLWGGYLFKIPADLRPQFTVLLGGLAVLTAAGFVTRIFTQVLHAHQRNDISNYVQILSLTVNIVVLWVALELRAGVFSLLVASAAAWVMSICAAVPCRVLEFWPRRGEWGRPNWRSFRGMFSFGADLFWIALGTQLINSSQVIIAAQTLGIEAAALWSVMTKPFVLVAQLAWRPITMSLSAFAEMHARGETARFWDRYGLLFTCASVGGGFLAVVFAFANGPFVAWWTGGKMHWAQANDWLLGLWLILLTQLCCHNSMFIVQKQIVRLKYVYFAEAAAFVVSSLVVTGFGGFPAMIACSIVCTALFTLAYGTRRMRACVGDSGTAWLWQSQKPLLRLLSFLVPLALVLGFALRGMPPLVQLIAGGIPLVTLGAIFLLRQCLPSQVTVQLLEFVPPGLRPLFVRLAAVPLATE